jgi:hypothetical protein
LAQRGSVTAVPIDLVHGWLDESVAMLGRKVPRAFEAL